MVTLAEYASRMPEEQKYIYYAGGNWDRIDKLPQTELVMIRAMKSILHR